MSLLFAKKTFIRMYAEFSTSAFLIIHDINVRFKRMLRLITILQMTHNRGDFVVLTARFKVVRIKISPTYWEKDQPIKTNAENFDWNVRERISTTGNWIADHNENDQAESIQ